MSQAARRERLLRLRLLAAALTLVSGGTMMAAGYLGDREGWLVAGLVTIPGGLIIFVAFALARKAEAETGDWDWNVSGPAMAVILLSGGVMVLAGYAFSAWWWGLAPFLATAGGVLIVLAFAIERHPSRTEQDAHAGS